MKQFPGFFYVIGAIMALAIIAGCIAPPEEPLVNTTSTKTGTATVIRPTSTPAPVYVTQVTPYETALPSGVTTEGTPGYHLWQTPTPIPEERSCRIYTLNQGFTYSGTAFAFNLKSPPMYITYTVQPQNITVRKVVTEQLGKKTEKVINYSTYDPLSYLEITVRNKDTGHVYLDDGFGKDYTTYLSRTLKVMDQDDMLVEIKGNKITADIAVWVKPVGNFDNADNMTFDTCKYWPGSTRDVTSLALINGTPTPTWTCTSC